MTRLGDRSAILRRLSAESVLRTSSPSMRPGWRGEVCWPCATQHQSAFIEREREIIRRADCARRADCRVNVGFERIAWVIILAQGLMLALSKQSAG